MLSQVVTLSDTANPPGARFWEVIDKPVGESATLSSATADEPTFTPTVEGTWLFKVTYNAVEASGNNNAIGEFITTQGGFGIKLANGIRIPGAGETNQFDGDGWHPAMDQALRVIGTGGGTTLDSSYDGGGSGAGRTITADANAVAVTSSAADNNNLFELTKSPAGSQSGDGLLVTMGANTTGAGISVAQSGSGPSIETSLGAVGAPAYSFSGDPNTGIYASAADELAITTAGNQATRWSVAGQQLSLNGGVGAPQYSFAGDPNSGVFQGLSADTVSIATGGVEACLWNASQQTLVAAGAVGAPGLGFGVDDDTGIYRSAVDEIAITTGGTQATRWSIAQQQLSPLGSLANPQYSFAGDDNTGMYANAPDQIRIVAGGAAGFTVTSTSVQFQQEIQCVNGDAGDPQVTSFFDQNSGMFWINPDILALSTGGTECVRWIASQQQQSPDGSAAAPQYSFVSEPDCGLYQGATADTLSVATAGTEAMQWSADQQSLATLGTAALPSLSFIGDPNTGIYSPGADQVAVSQGGAQVAAFRTDDGFELVQPVQTSGTPQALRVAPGAHTTLTASADVTDVHFDLARSVQLNTGAVALWESVKFSPPTIAFVGSSTVTQAMNVVIDGGPAAGTNATITDSFALAVNGRIITDQGVALGGGSTATLGTVGGSGPSATAQARWLQVDTTAGGTGFLAVWE